VPRADAPLQLVWTGLAVLVFAAVLLVVRDHTTLSRYTYTAAAAGLVLLLLPALPGLGREINGPASGSRSARSPSSPARPPSCC
jgi:cell division protein FtsW (lipid II flippase)